VRHLVFGCAAVTGFCWSGCLKCGSSLRHLDYLHACLSKSRKVEAEAAFRAATRADPLFAEAWYNLSDLSDEQGRSEAAIDCLRRALRAAPEYADAMFNLALLLQRNNKHAEAAEYWRRYLANDGQSEWAVRARRSLKFCEMQVHLSAS
jgi:tetratricopeptide (TPR) repeat protein